MCPPPPTEIAIAGGHRFRCCCFVAFSQLGLARAHFVIWKHRGWQFPLLQQSPQLWNTSVWLLRAIAFESVYLEVHRPVYLVVLRSDSRQNCNVSQASLAQPRKTKCFPLHHASFSCRKEIFSAISKGFGLKCSCRVETIC